MGTSMGPINGNVLMGRLEEFFNLNSNNHNLIFENYS